MLKKNRKRKPFFMIGGQGKARGISSLLRKDWPATAKVEEKKRLRRPIMRK